MENTFIYDAFISYRHLKLDKAVADKLQRLLEGYVPPASVRKGQSPKKLRIFRDETELPTSSNLGDDIKNALENSRFLIVVCSSMTAKSRWCMEEITFFKSLHGGSTENILTILVEGEPSEVFPRELCSETRTVTDEDGSIRTITVDIEPLAANVSAPTERESLKKLNREYLRIAAPLLGCGYDTLYNRNQRRFVRRVIAVASVIIVLLVAFGIYTSFMVLRIIEQRDALEVQTRIAEDNLALAIEQEAIAIANLALAVEQEAVAVANLNHAKSLILSNAIDYAYELNRQGARSRAGAVLLAAYRNIDTSREDSYALIARFRDTVINTIYYRDETLPFAKTNVGGAVIRIDIVPEHGFAAVVTAANIHKLDINTGDILRTFAPPAGDFFVATNIQGHYILAVTDMGRIMVINTLTNEQTLTENMARYFRNETRSDRIEAIVYNENASVIVVLTRMALRHGLYNEIFGETPDCITYISADDAEVYERVWLTMIPADLAAMRLYTDQRQVLVYKNDFEMRLGEDNIFNISDNGRFVALRYNQFVYLSYGSLHGRIMLNAEITLIELDYFNHGLSPAENRENITRFIEFNPDDESYRLRIYRYHVSNNGVITLDGEAFEVFNGEPVEGSWEMRTIVYDSVRDVEIFNEMLITETSLVHSSRFIPIENQDNDNFFVYLDRREDLTHLRVFDLRSGTWVAEYELPAHYEVLQCFLYTDRAFNPSLMLVGRRFGDSRNYILGNSFAVANSVEAVQTLDTISTASAVDIESSTMIVGYRDGDVLMFNHGVLPPSVPDGSLTRRVAWGTIHDEGVSTGINLQTVFEDSFITRVSFNPERTLMFGFENSSRRVYSIWNLENGEIIASFCSTDFIGDGWGFEMRINSNFTYAIAEDRRESFMQTVYYVLDVATGEILYTYVHASGTGDDWTSLDFNRRDTVFFGIGDSPYILWFFHEDTLVLEVVNITTSETISSYAISERMERDAGFDNFLGIFGGIRYTDVHFNIGGDIIVFETSNDGAVYSLATGRAIFVGHMAEVESDLSAIYLNAFSFPRIDLLPCALYDILRQSPFVGTMTDADIRATGLDIFDR